jgi:hypothetical protein
MLVVVCSSRDRSARDLCRRWRAHDARLLTARDLSLPGWRHRLDDSAASCAVISGRSVPARSITGVLNRLPSVDESELPHIVSHDRAYVAAEMNAFLLAWMSSLSCPIVNRPTPNCLVGPNWRIEQWTAAAASLRIPVHPWHHSSARNAVPAPHPAVGAEVIVAGSRAFGPPELARAATDLARLAGVALVAVQFSRATSDAAFVGVNLLPPLSSPLVANAAFDCLSGDRPC